ncbi:MAG: hypothetical protein ACI94Y_000671 [Maribacter sp.]|jgi:hypothetical protein
MLYADEIFKWANTLTLLPWLLMMIAPNWKWTKKLILGLFFPAIFALAYLLLFTMSFEAENVADFSSLEGVAKLFSVKEAVLVGWLHYLAFDLLVGTWEYVDAKKQGIAHYILVPCLFLTLMAGPVGFLLYAVIRYLKTKKFQVAVRD